VDQLTNHASSTGYNPVLVADRDYWDANKTSDTAGNWPANVPVMRPNQTVTRTLDVYNDTFSGTAVDRILGIAARFRNGSYTGFRPNTSHYCLGYVYTNSISFCISQMLRMEHSATWFYIRKNPA